MLEDKSVFVEFAGNLVPITKSGDQLELNFRAFRENRLPFTVRARDTDEKAMARILFMPDPKASTCNQSIVDVILLFANEPFIYWLRKRGHVLEIVTLMEH